MSGALIIGAGPGLGLAIAQRFAREGGPVTLIARSRRTLDEGVAALAASLAPVLAITADATDEAALVEAIAAASERFGTPDALIYNAAVIRADSVGQLTADEHLKAWNVNVVGALRAAATVGPSMARRGHGSIILTGGMPVPDAGHVSLSLGKAGIRAVTEMLDQHYGRHGVHAATVTVAGAIAPGTDFDPADIAEHYWRLHAQVPGQWEREVMYEGPNHAHAVASRPVGPQP